MNLSPLLVLSLVGGYAFSTIWTGSLYHASRETGHRLYFRAIFYSFFLLVSSTLIHIILFTKLEHYQVLLELISETLNFNTPKALIWSQESKISILLMSLGCGIVFGHLLNLPKWPFVANYEIPFFKVRPFIMWQKLILKLAIKNNDFERLLYRGFTKNLPIMFTLNTGKLYVGWMVRAPNPVETRKAVRILPILSGYRDNDTQEVTFTTDYYFILKKIENNEHLEHLTIGDFEIVLPSDQICASHLFDIDAYFHFHNPEENKDDENTLSISTDESE